jgi:hypothetical protein
MIPCESTTGVSQGCGRCRIYKLPQRCKRNAADGITPFFMDGDARSKVGYREGNRRKYANSRFTAHDLLRTSMAAGLASREWSSEKTLGWINGGGLLGFQDLCSLKLRSERYCNRSDLPKPWRDRPFCIRSRPFKTPARVSRGNFRSGDQKEGRDELLNRRR